MNNYFDLSVEEQRQVLKAAEGRIGLPAYTIEKDLWVTTILQIVFTLPFADKLLFKGGTSLSKVGKLINRFSEDIDLAIDPTYFGVTGDLTKKQLKAFRKESSLFVCNDFYTELVKAIEKYGLDSLCTVTPEEEGEGDNTYPEPRKIWITYSRVIPGELSYLGPDVELEIGARSLFEPYEVNKVRSFVEENFSNIQTTLVDSDIMTAAAEKTFLEKAFLLHEIFSVVGGGVNASRKSRHLYDLYMMMDKDFAIAVIQNDDLWNNIQHHRKVFTSVKDVDYTYDIRKNIQLVPHKDIFSIWESDYAAMFENMIYGPNKPTFNDIIEKIKVLQDRFRR